MCHQPYSNDLAPSDNYLFPNLKKHFHRQRFLTDDELKYATEEWLKGQSELFYLLAFKNSVIVTNWALTKAMNVLKNKYVLACPCLF